MVALAQILTAKLMMKSDCVGYAQPGTGIAGADLVEFGFRHRNRRIKRIQELVGFDLFPRRDASVRSNPLLQQNGLIVHLGLLSLSGCR